MRYLWIICICFCICGCSHTATFYKNDEEVGRIESGSKGVYTFKDKEVEKIYPYAIRALKHKKYDDFKMVDYKRLIPLLIKSIQELEQKLKEV